MRTIPNAFQDTRMVVRLWFKLLPGLRSRLIALGGIPVLWFAMWVAIQSGSSILLLARRGDNSQIGKYAAGYVVALQDGDLGALGMSVVGAVVLAGFISPFTSGGNVTLIPDTDLLGIRPAKLHAYFTSVLTTAVSIIGFFQLMALTLIASLLAIDGDPTRTVLIGWLSWFPLLAITAAQMWFTELMLRGVRRRVRIILSLGLVIGLTVLLVLFEGARSFAGSGANQYARMLRSVSGGDNSAFWQALSILAIGTVLCLFAGLWLCQKAQSLPAHVGSRKAETLIKLRMSANPWLMFAKVTAVQVVRNREIRRPLLVIFAVNLAGCWLVDSPSQQMSALLTIPVAAGAAWAANMFGLLGPGMPWLATQPNLMRNLPSVTFPIQFALSFTLCTIAWVLLVARHGIGAERFVQLELATVAVSFMMTRAAFHHAARNPTLVRLGGRGDTVVRPGQAIAYTLRYTPGAALTAMILLSFDTIPATLAGVVGVCCWSAARWMLSDRLWADEERRMLVVRRVASA